MDMCDNTSRPTKMFVLIYGIFFVLCSGANGQNVTCNAVESNTTNVFASYNVNVHGATNYSLIYHPAEYSPNMRLPVDTTQVTVTAYSTSPSTEIGNCTFNVTVNLPDLPIKCPPTMDLTVGTDPGQPFYTYPDSAPFNVTYPSESLTYVPYGNITVVRSYDGSMDGPSLDISLSTQRAYSVMVTISDGTLEKSCIEATVTVEDREPPAIVCPDDIFQTETTIDFNTFKLKSSIDNSGGLITLAIVPFATTVFPVGTTTYTFIATDRANNNASCSFNVTVELAPTSNSTQAPLTSTTQESTNTMESTTVAAGPQDMPDNLPIIISCSVAGVVLLLIIIILAVFCSSPGRRRIFGIGPKEPVRIRNVGASRHGVATDPVLLNDRLERTTSNLYASTNIDDDVESPEMTETDGATGGPKDMMDINGIHVNDAYTGET